MTPPRMRISATVLGTPHPRRLASFYARLLGWSITVDEGDWVMVRPPDGGSGLSFQAEPGHQPPVWPAVPGEQQMMMHLDIGVADLAAAVAWAEDCGASLADHQPQAGVRVMRDPEGHLFCLFPLA